MSSPARKRGAENASPGLCTPTDASPETSIATPHYGERESGNKRGRVKKDDETGASGRESSGRESSGERASRSSVRQVAVKMHLDATRTRMRELCADLAANYERARRASAHAAREEARLAAEDILDELEEVERRLRAIGEDEPAVAAMLTYLSFVRRKSRTMVTLNDINEDTLQLILRRIEAPSPKELLALSLVNKRFRAAIRSPTVWHTLDLSRHAATMTNKVLYGIVKDDNAFASIEVLNLSGCSQLTDLSVLKVLNKCHHTIREIDLSGCELLTLETAEYIGFHCHELERLDLTGCKRVPTTFLFQNLPIMQLNLKDLRVKGTKHLNGRVDEVDFEDLVDAIAKYVRWLQSFDGTVFDKGDVRDVMELVHVCEEHLEFWRSGNAVAICDHASELQNNDPTSTPMCTIFPECGHVMCVECSAVERRNMMREGGRYVYPCSHCAHPVRFMPAPGGFEIVVHSPEDFKKLLAERRRLGGPP